MLFSIFYDFALILIYLAALPKMLYMMLVHKKYRKSFLKRFGKDFPTINKGDRYLIWIHAVSVGETKAVVPLIKIIKAELDNPIIVVSNSTETGHAEAQRSIPFADYHVFLPHDFGWIMRPLVKSVAPDLVILCESDYWFNFFKAAKAGGAKIALVNGKLSERSMERYSKVPFFTKKLFSFLDVLCVQNRHYFERFEKIGVPAEKLLITGNLKLDENYPKLSEEQLIGWKEQLGIHADDQVLVAGSTHDPEEKLVLSLLNRLWTQYPKLKAVIVPRHPERFNEVAGLIQRQNIPFVRFSQLNGSKPPTAKVILIDAMGLLRKCYQLANIAIVGGSFTHRVGGHNILEPSWYGVPVIFGPHMHSQPELDELAQEYMSGIQVDANHVEQAVMRLLKEPEKRELLGSAGLKLVSDMHGATSKTWVAIKPLV